MVKVFVGNGQILNVNHTIANVNFDAEDQFTNVNLSNDVIINVDKLLYLIFHLLFLVLLNLLMPLGDIFL